jgi:LuxR family transcriptional regulator, maltose regulon positive regulatory protein
MIGKDNPDCLGTITGDDRYVADYLYRECLTRLPEEVQWFLCSTAVLGRLCGPLCDAVLGSSGGVEELRRLEASSLSVIPLDRRREWYRYHVLFREFLSGELRRRVSDAAIEKLHLTAADWYESNGSPKLAVEHLLETTERDRSLQLRWSAFVDSASFDLVPTDGTACFASARAMLRTAMCAHGPEAMRSDAAFAVAQEPVWGAYRDTAPIWLLAEAHLLLRASPGGRRSFCKGVGRGGQVASPRFDRCQPVGNGPVGHGSG